MGNSSSKNEIKVDKCKTQLNSYLKCVEDHPNGLSEGDECKIEADQYKKCRTATKLVATKTDQISK